MTRAAPLLALAFALAGCATSTRPAADRPITEAELREHIAVLASDRFEGRKPGAPSSRLTLDYISRAWASAGLTPAGPNGWLQPVPLVDTAPAGHQLTIEGGADRVRLTAENLVAIGSQARTVLTRAELLRLDPTQAPPAAVRGAVAVVDAARIGSGGAARRARQRLFEAGAVGVLTLVPDANWAGIRQFLAEPSTALAQGGGGGLVMYAPQSLLDRTGAGARPRISGTVTTSIHRYTSPNVIGRIPGTGGTGEAVAVIGHWDHLGAECRPAGTPDRICNGAVDNASGIAVMIEVAERLARGPKPTRDILFIATTAEESGLLGARHYVANPTIPLAKLVAVLNIDTIAIGPRGLPVSAVNRGNTSIDPLIDAAARLQRRPLDQDLDANAFIQRQDGAAFTEAGVPAVMAGGSFADMSKLQTFLRSTYHGPEDELVDTLPLGGAAEDADLHVILARMLADPERYPTPPRR